MNNTCFPYQFLYVVLLCDHCSEYSWDIAILTDSHPTLQLIYLHRLPMQYFVPFQLKYIINLDVYELLILVIIQSYFRTSKTNILEDGRLSHKKTNFYLRICVTTYTFLKNLAFDCMSNNATCNSFFSFYFLLRKTDIK